jgi:hypothetical protein
MRIFFLLLVLGRTQQKNRFDPPSPALTHPQPFRSVSPRYARLHSTEWLGMNLQKEVCTPDLDRMFGFGLKYETSFKDTHLQRL